MAGRSKSTPRPGGGEARGDPLRPLLVDYFTRDGSTLMMRLLATSPQIAVGGGYPYEHKYFAYLFRWAHLIERTDWPGRIWNANAFATLTQEQQMPMMGAPPWSPRELLEGGGTGEEFADHA